MDGQTDGLYRANSCFPRFCEHALKEVILVWKHCETLGYHSVYIINNYILSKLDIYLAGCSTFLHLPAPI